MSKASSAKSKGLSSISSSGSCKSHNKEQAKLIASQTAERVEKKLKLLEKKTKLELEIEKEEVYLKLVEVKDQSNLSETNEKGELKHRNR